MEDNSSYLSYLSSLWDKIYEYDEDIALAYKEEMVQETDDYNDHFDDGDWSNESDLSDFDDPLPVVTSKTLQPLATGHYNNCTYHLGAEPVPQGKALGTRRVRHYNEIEANFVSRLMGSGCFGWPPLRRRLPLSTTGKVKVDCCVDSLESVVRELSLKGHHKNQKSPDTG